MYERIAELQKKLDKANVDMRRVMAEACLTPSDTTTEEFKRIRQVIMQVARELGKIRAPKPADVLAGKSGEGIMGESK